jgi:hypothetical protein
MSSGGGNVAGVGSCLPGAGAKGGATTIGSAGKPLAEGSESKEDAGYLKRDQNLGKFSMAGGQLLSRRGIGMDVPKWDQKFERSNMVGERPGVGLGAKSARNSGADKFTRPATDLGLRTKSGTACETSGCAGAIGFTVSPGCFRLPDGGSYSCVGEAADDSGGAVLQRGAPYMASEIQGIGKAVMTSGATSYGKMLSQGKQTSLERETVCFRLVFIPETAG